MDHTPFSIKYSRSSTLTVGNDQRREGVTGSHDEDHAVSVAPVLKSTGSDGAEVNSTPLSVTALVIGLAAVAFFLIMVVYVIYKVHWSKRGENNKKLNSKAGQKSLEEGPKATPPSMTTVASNLSNLWRPTLPHHTGDARLTPAHDACDEPDASFDHRSSNEDTVNTIPKARLTAARFLPSDQ